MKCLQGSGPVQIAVVCCPHGDELIGEIVFNHYQSIIHNFPGLRLIFANVQAHTAGKRFVESDLNRSFPGSATGTHEEKLAHQILPLISDATYVLDLHTTTSDIVMTPIVANLHPATRRILNLTTSHEIAIMEPPIADHALIGQVPAGVSLEFNRQYATTPAALTEITVIIANLLKNASQPALNRRIFHVTGTIPKSYNLPSNAADFQPLTIPDLSPQPIYPFLLGEQAYATQFHAFAATSVTANMI